MAVAASVAMCAAMAACGTSVSVTPQGQPDGPVLSIGIPVDEPYMGWYADGSFSGFDVDVARYVAQVLGYGSSQITFHAVTPANAAAKLQDGTVALVVGDQTVPAGDDQDDAQDPQVSVSQAYLRVPDAFLVVENGDHTLTRPDQLQGQSVCVVTGTADRALVQETVSDVHVSEQPSYPQCVSALLTGVVQAVAGSEPVIRGLAAQTGDQYTSVMDATFGSQGYGVAVAGDKAKMLSLVDDAIGQMIASGEWTRAMERLQTDEPGLNGGKSVKAPTVHKADAKQ
ncbi:hypothetical protein BIFGAL_03264 [Bifidobacterium gallicum DSM 20093 = LMG 11596]|uniref:Solute-binding protein family 3/N-terminal domain-containing protein n=2 Tax=Bifidobacterium gallicum DSM 20093 = LMG 11596 TaxID=561180 RepID=D1NTU6_9BIFI|nr:hypothetical protein BIFGAL_03264 [Bifidobacterium gallicum DSM 20093 = LMG 11596]